MLLCWTEIIVNSLPSWNDKEPSYIIKWMGVQLLFIDFDDIWFPGKGFNNMRSCWVDSLVQSIKSLHDFFLKVK